MSAYILPPINAAAINAKTTRFGITDAMLVSSSVPETPPATSAAGTTYALGAECSTGTAGGVITCWKSLQAGNIGRTPDVSPTWWTTTGTTYAVWAAGTSWATGALVIRPGLHAVYERAAPGGVDATLPENDLTKWRRVSSTNRWAMFDMLSAAPTVGVSPITVVLAPGRVTGLGILNADGNTVEVTETSGASTVFYELTSLDSTAISSWEDYFFAEANPRANFVRNTIQPYTDAQLTIKVTGASTTKLGKLIVGKTVYLGSVLADPRVREKTYHVITRDERSGELTDIDVRKTVPLVSQSLLVEKASCIKAFDALRSAKVTPCLIVGIDNDKDEYAELLTFLSLCTDVDIDPKHTTHAVINAELEGV